MPIPQSNQVTLNAAGQIDQDLPCLKCGYNLRTLQPDQICPECGESVLGSIRGDLLEHSDPTWIKRVAGGMRWIVIGVVCTFVLGCMGVLPRPISLITGAGLLLVYLFGFWNLTRPEPGRAETETAFCMRRLARIGSIGGFLLVPVADMLGLAVIRIGSRSPVVPGTPKASIAPGALGIIAAWVLILAYAGRLAQRIPDERIARNTKIVVRGIAAGSAVWMLLVPLVLALPLGGTLRSGIMATAAIIVAIPTALLFLWSIKILYDCRKQFSAAAKAASVRKASQAGPTATVKDGSP